MLRLRRRDAAALIASLLFAASASGQVRDTIPATIDRIFAQYDRTASPGCALGVFRDGEIVYSRGYGMANIEHGVAISPTTVFDIGSTSKQFAAASIMLLVNDGKLSLDDDVRRHIPEMPAYTRPVTIRHLFNHTSGLRDYLTLMSLAGVDFDGVTTDKDALALIVKQKETNFPPGDEHLYSNSGYFLLSEIVKRASGKTLRAFAQERLFAPLGMRNTHFHDDHRMIVPRRATGYEPAPGGGFRISMSGFEQTGDGAVHTTVEDLLLWDRNFYEPRVGGKHLLDELHRVGTLTSGRTLTYASGLSVDEHRGLRRVRHGGAWAGYRADLLRFPDQRLSVACLCNLATANPSRLADQVADVFLSSAYAARPAAQVATDTKPVVPTSAAELASVPARYRHVTSGAITTIAARDGKLVIEPSRTALVSLGGGRFRVEGSPVEFAFDVASGTKRMTRTASDGTVDRFEAFVPAALSASQLAEYAGVYRSEELDIDYTVSVSDGRLHYRRGRTAPVALEPTIADEFRADGVVLRFERGPRKRVVGFSANAGRVRNIRFARLAAGDDR